MRACTWVASCRAVAGKPRQPAAHLHGWRRLAAHHQLLGAGSELWLLLGCHGQQCSAHAQHPPPTGRMLLLLLLDLMLLVLVAICRLAARCNVR